jgi:hypothetical protein
MDDEEEAVVPEAMAEAVAEAGVTEEMEEAEGRRFSRWDGERSDSRGAGSAKDCPLLMAGTCVTWCFPNREPMPSAH